MKRRKHVIAIIWFVFIFLLLMTMLSCRPVRVIQPEIVDRAKITIRDTTIIVQMPPARVRDVIEIPVPKEINTDPSVLQTEYATSIAYIRRSELKHELRQHEREIKETIPEAIRTELRTVHEKEYIEVERELTWWQRLWIRTGQVLGGAVIVAGLGWIVKLRFF